jgi:hypothetical protein
VPQNIPNGHLIYQHFPLKDPPKFTQIGIFGLKICHLATLLYKRAARFFSLLNAKTVKNKYQKYHKNTKLQI